MNLKNSVLVLCLVFLVGCSKNSPPETALIEIAEFEELAKKEHVKIIDFRKLSAYNQGHVKNAIQMWRSDIEDASFPYGGMKASKKTLESLFRMRGINSEDTLLILDDKGLCDAARLWWVLHYYNFTKVKLLNGGMSAIKTANIPLTTEKLPLKPSAFSFSNTENTAYYASRHQMKKAVENHAIILDTRTSDEHVGKVLKNGAFLKGKIPTSRLLDWANAIHYSGDHKIKTPKDLKVIYDKIGANKNDTIYVYCHSGVRSAHTTFVLTQVLGYQHVLNYDGSWTEWSYFKNQQKLKNQN